MPSPHDDAKPTAPTHSSSRWNSLEVAKLIVPLVGSFIVSLVIFGVGESYKKSQDAQQSLERKLSEDRAKEQRAFEIEQNHARELEIRLVQKRVELWDFLAPRMNDVYAYLLYVGHWKDLKAQDVIAKKREMDHIIYSYRPFFSDDFFKAYVAFTDAAYEQYGGWRNDARLKTTVAHRDETDGGHFTGTDNRDAIHKAYYDVMKVAATELQLNVVPAPPRPRGPD